MFRIIIGGTLLFVGIMVFAAAGAASHTGLSIDFTEGETWLLWGMFVVPITLGLWLLLGRSLRKLFR